MTDFQLLTVVIAFGTFVSAMIFGMLSVVIGILNLIKKK